MFSYIAPEEQVPQQHPLRRIRVMVAVVLNGLSPQFARLYSYARRPSIAPEQFLCALLRQVLSMIRGERLFMERLDNNLLLRWQVG